MLNDDNNFLLSEDTLPNLSETVIKTTSGDSRTPCITQRIGTPRYR